MCLGTHLAVCIITPHCIHILIKYTYLKKKEKYEFRLWLGLQLKLPEVSFFFENDLKSSHQSTVSFTNSSHENLHTIKLHSIKINV